MTVLALRTNKRRPKRGGGPVEMMRGELEAVRDTQLDDLLVDATSALLEHLGYARATKLQRDGVMHSRDGALAAVVGYVGDDVEGALTMMSAPSLLRKTVPLPAGASCDGLGKVELLDWSAEIANQLLGRVKNKLTSRELSFKIAPPIPMFAQCLSLPPLRRPSPTTWFEFSTPDGSLCVRFEMLAPSGWALPAEAPNVEPSLPEGELALF